MKKIPQYPDHLRKLFPEENELDMAKTVTFQVTDACSLACTYCYQINKGKHRMKFETATKFIDMLLDNESSTAKYLDSSNTQGVIIEFIGGEPFLEIDLIDQITDYFIEQLILRHHPWATRYRISICSNGVAYFEPKVQAYIKKHLNHLSFSISIDGNKELHDSCRVFPDGSGSYDIAMAGVKHFIEVLGGTMGSKMTLCPANINHTFEAVKSLIENGYEEINLNCVYEEGWTNDDAKVLYEQLKLLADYMLENDLFDKIFVSIFENEFFKPMPEEENQNWCWGVGTPILTTNGYKPIEKIKVGDMVYTEDGAIHSVINTMSHFADNCVNIHVSGAYDLVCTKNHQLFTIPFDYIGNKNVKHYKEYEKCAVENIAHQDLIKLFSLPKRNVSYNADVAYLVGRYIGDGWDHYCGKGHSICCSFDETEELRSCFDKAMVDYGVYKNKTVNQFSIYLSDNVINKELHRILSCCGHTASQKHLPPECFYWDDESLGALLRGYFDADGSINKNGQMRISTTSYQLALEIMVILRTLGYTPTCHKNKRGGKSIIQGRQVNIKDRYEIYFYEDVSRSEYVHEYNGNMWTYGLKMTDAEPQMVYNITVDTNHSYVAGGIVSANCGGNGQMISVDYKGDIYPCIRYMESSLGDDRPPIIIGNVDTGILQTKEQCDWHDCLTCITRRSQSTDECFNCPIASGCSHCTAYNYQVFGTPNKKATYICIMHKARALANAYYWNKGYRQNNENKRFKLWIPEEWALEIIDQDEWDYLKELER